MKFCKKHSNLVIFLLTIFSLGIIFGIILGLKQDSLFKNDIIYNAAGLKNSLLANNINNLLSHSILLVIIILSSIIIPLYFINFVYLFFKGITIGFNIYILSISFGFKGFISAVIYNLIFNFLFIFLIIFMLIKGNFLLKSIISYLLNKEKSTLESIKRSLLAIVLVGSVIIINDLILYFLSPTLLSKIFFLLK